MKNQKALRLLALFVLAISVLGFGGCSALQSGGTHEMGPPDRSETMSNGFMLQQSPDSARY